MAEHLRADELLALALGTDDPENRQHHAAHLEACAGCADALRAARAEHEQVAADIRKYADTVPAGPALNWSSVAPRIVGDSAPRPALALRLAASSIGGISLLLIVTVGFAAAAASVAVVPSVREAVFDAARWVGVPIELPVDATTSPTHGQEGAGSRDDQAGAAEGAIDHDETGAGEAGKDSSTGGSDSSGAERPGAASRPDGAEATSARMPGAGAWPESAGTPTPSTVPIVVPDTASRAPDRGREKAPTSTPESKRNKGKKKASPKPTVKEKGKRLPTETPPGKSGKKTPGARPTKKSAQPTAKKPPTSPPGKKPPGKPTKVLPTKPSEPEPKLPSPVPTGKGKGSGKPKPSKTPSP